MKQKLLIFTLTVFGFVALHAQQTPKPSTPPLPPSSLPPPPEAPEPPDTPMPPKPNSPSSKPDTTHISIGDKHIYIIDKKDNNNKNKEEWEKELEESMEDLKEDLEEAKEELEAAKNEMNKELNTEHDDEMENRSPDAKRKYKLKYKKGGKKSGADVGFLNFDLGLNLIRVDGSVTELQESDLKLKTWGSWSYTFNFLPTKIFLGSKHLILMTSFGWRISQFEFKEKLQFTHDEILVYTKNPDIKKSQFLIHQLQIPLGLYVESKKIKGLGRIGFGIGGYAGLLIHQQHEMTFENPDQYIETEEDFGFEEFRYGVNARFDIGALKLYANLDLNPLWKNHDYKNVECGLWLDF